MIGSHLIFGAYGFWLPNDPRGSWSDFVGAWNLLRFGPATTTNEAVSLAHNEHNRRARVAAKESLKRPAVEFNGIQARTIGEGIAQYAASSGLKIWACAILPDHVHLVVGAFRIDPKQIVVQLKGSATERLLAVKLHPFGDRHANGRVPKCFARGQWEVFLDTPDEVLRAIRYAEENPVKEGKPRQRWSFVAPFDPNDYR